MDSYDFSVRRLAPLLLALGAAGPLTAQGITVYSDGVFLDSDWRATVYTDGPGGSMSVSRLVFGGNPSEHRRTRALHNAASTTNKSQLAVVHRRLGLSYDPAVSGDIATIDFSIDTIKLWAEWPGWAGYAVGPAVFQGGDAYAVSLFSTPETVWTRKAFAGLSAASFQRIDPVTGARIPNEHPDFSCAGQRLEFGYYQGTTHTGPTPVDRASAVDNFNLVVHSGAGAGSFTPIGAGCGPMPPVLSGGPFQLPTAGQPYTLSISNLPLWQPAGSVYLALGTRYASPIDLTSIGAPGCLLHIAPVALVPCYVVPIGISSVTLPLPNAPGAQFHVQGVVVDRAANPLGIKLSNAAAIVVGC